ncbi:co-regulatory protein PtrA N-terminal domain-containing protein [Pseudomonas sp. sp1636]|uniref:co-regulatory protein PtrA N-terminal domain-containing protein n=1 Tax=Pseudomonas sp. sp1636 TaxID=3036707 RepID=UPI0025A55471|nr:co-regulatory protein PtrA N-terminal domain-containing protein [Pseudomonas sp. sp1636]MDM8351162.1 co-regulatory protein PtrA N-terminal domain-containing protein [Pseudomonas sp. sp1636]
MKSMKTLIAIAALSLSSLAMAEGGADRTLERAVAMRDAAETVLAQAEQAPAGQRHTQMAKHMNMLDDMMQELHASPDAAMGSEQHLAWMEQHDKLVNDALAQMQRQHKLMRTECQQ